MNEELSVWLISLILVSTYLYVIMIRTVAILMILLLSLLYYYLLDTYPSCHKVHAPLHGILHLFFLFRVSHKWPCNYYHNLNIPECPHLLLLQITCKTHVMTYIIHIHFNFLKLVLLQYFSWISDHLAEHFVETATLNGKETFGRFLPRVRRNV